MTQRLISSVTSDEEWPRFDGALASQGIDPLELPIDRFLSLAYWYLVRGGNRDTPEGRQKLAQFEARLWRPPPGEEVTEGPWSADAETAAFRSLKTALNPSAAAGAAASARDGAATPSDKGTAPAPGRTPSVPPRRPTGSARQRRATRAAGGPTGRQ